MKRRGPNKHPLAVIVAAIKKHAAGMTLSQVAREAGVAKSLVKYWTEHPERYIPDAVPAKRVPAVGRLIQHGELAGWKRFLHFIAIPKKDIDAMEPLQRIEALAKLKDILMGISGRTGMPDAGATEAVVEVERSARFIVKNWARKKDGEGQDAGGAERPPEAGPAAEPIDVTPEEPGGNGARR
jgi:hypothetical protein